MPVGNISRTPKDGHWVHSLKFPLYQQEGEAQGGAVISLQAQSSAKCLSSAQIGPPSLLRACAPGVRGQAAPSPGRLWSPLSGGDQPLSQVPGRNLGKAAD